MSSLLFLYKIYSILLIQNHQASVGDDVATWESEGEFVVSVGLCWGTSDAESKATLQGVSGAGV